jgi:adenosylmethionine-8-amino-7-oxononanoate aminotransferase
MAAQYWINQGQGERTQFVAFKDGYHGDTTGAMAVSDPHAGMHSIYRGLMPQHVIADLPADDASAAAIDALVVRHGGDIAGIIVEPLVQGAGGMKFHDAAVLKRLRALADKHDLLLIFDEVFTGFGRSGTMFAAEAAGVTPDIVALSKALTGGTLPLAATVATRKVFDAFWSDDPKKALMHGPSYMANALACAAANASLDLFESEPRLQQVAAISSALSQGLEPCRGMPGVKDVRVKGAIGVVEMDAIGNIDALRARLVAEGVFVRPFGNIIYLTPAFTIPKDELKTLTDAVVKVVRERKQESGDTCLATTDRSSIRTITSGCARTFRGWPIRRSRACTVNISDCAAIIRWRNGSTTSCPRVSPSRCTSPRCGATPARSTRRAGCNRSPTDTAFRTGSSARPR